MQSIITVNNLVKNYGEVKAVDGISFCVQRGSFFAFLGQNGAGKSTTINVLIGLLAKDHGEISYAGGSYAAFKNKIGTVFQNNILDENLTVEENMRLFGALYFKAQADIDRRFDEICTLLSLADFAKTRVKNLSGGQRRKAEIARALWCNPEILFLDEPTTGLDPKTRVQVWDVINNLRKTTGMTVFLTTHYMEETAEADEIVVIHKGKIVASGSPAELKAQYSSDKLLLTPQNAETLAAELTRQSIPFEKVADTYAVAVTDAQQAIALLHELKGNIRFFESRMGTMDDVFLNAVGESIGEDR